MNSGIYGILNKETSRWYIGSSKEIKRRWQVHKRLLQSNKHYNSKLQRAWNKYGPEVWEWVVLQVLPPEKEVLEEAETKTIAEKRAYEEGYNQSAYGGRVTWTPEMREAIRIRNRERMWTPEMRKNASKGQEGLIKNPPPITDESRKKMSEKGKGRRKSEEHRQKIGAFHKGRKRSEETRERIRQAMIQRHKQARALTESQSRIEDFPPVEVATAS